MVGSGAGWSGGEADGGGTARIIPFLRQPEKGPPAAARPQPRALPADAAIGWIVGEAGIRLAALGTASFLRNAQILLAPAVVGPAELARVAMQLAADQLEDDLLPMLTAGCGCGPRVLPPDRLAARTMRWLHLSRCCLQLACGVAWPTLAAADRMRASAA
ncbi:hypothetical protein [Benzoatithermus flavus]|uniref:Uncharacterized protein n=1 Tax=Benzoatithermus flavus TaxID=3108223 RepID=A0ABU8XX04_9PROT